MGFGKRTIFEFLACGVFGFEACRFRVWHSELTASC